MSFTPLNALTAFLAVARLRSFAAAAKEMGVSSSAVSQSVKQLEAKLGIPLLIRTSRSVALTDVGQRLLENAGPAIDQAMESLKNVSAQAGEITGRVRLTVPTAAVNLMLAPVLPRFVSRYPKVELEVYVDDKLIDAVGEGYDAGIRLIESIDRDMIQMRVSQEVRFVVAGAPSYFARRGIPEHPKDLLEHDCLGMRYAPNVAAYAWEFERGKKSWRLPVRGILTANNTELRHQMALEGLGLVYTIESSIERELARGDLRIVLESYGPVLPGFYLYYPSRRQASPAFKAFVDFLRDEQVPKQRVNAKRKSASRWK